MKIPKGFVWATGLFYFFLAATLLPAAGTLDERFGAGSLEKYYTESPFSRLAFPAAAQSLYFPLVMKQNPPSPDFSGIWSVLVIHFLLFVPS